MSRDYLTGRIAALEFVLRIPQAEPARWYIEQALTMARASLEALDKLNGASGGGYTGLSHDEIAEYRGEIGKNVLSAYEILMRGDSGAVCVPWVPPPIPGVRCPMFAEIRVSPVWPPPDPEEESASVAVDEEIPT